MQVEISSSTHLGPGSWMRSPKCEYWVGGEEELRAELEKHRRLQVGRRQTSERNEEGTVRFGATWERFLSWDPRSKRVLRKEGRNTIKCYREV